VADPEGVKKPTGNQLSTQAKFVKFDHTKTEEQKAKHSRTGGMFNPTFAGDLISSPAAATSSPSTTTGHVRRITEEIELYDEDEIEEKSHLKHGIGTSMINCWMVTSQSTRFPRWTRPKEDSTMRMQDLLKLALKSWLTWTNRPCTLSWKD
jgi:hypothetical protein